MNGQDVDETYCDCYRCQLRRVHKLHCRATFRHPDSKTTCEQLITTAPYSTLQAAAYAKADLSHYAFKSGSRLDPIVSHASAMMQARVWDVMLTYESKKL